MFVPSEDPERGISPYSALYSCGRIHIRLLCAAAVTIALQKSTLPDRLNSQPPFFRMKWQMLSVSRSQRLRRFEDAVITSEAPFPTQRRKCARWHASEGSAFRDPGLSVFPTVKVSRQLRANIRSASARIEHTKFPVMNTCAKRVGGYPRLSNLALARRIGRSESSSGRGA